MSSLSQEVQDIFQPPTQLQPPVCLNIDSTLSQYVNYSQSTFCSQYIYDNPSKFNVDSFHFDATIIENPTLENYHSLTQTLLSIQYSPMKLEPNPVGFCQFITTRIEQILNAIHINHSNTPLPRTLSETLLKLYEEESLPRSIVLMCLIIIGPPLSLNIRNLLWHGFFSPIDLNQTLISTLIVLYQTILPYSPVIQPKKIPERLLPFFNMPCPSISIDDINFHLNKCPFVFPERKSFIIQAFQKLPCNDMNHVFYGLYLISEMEHLLRVAFVTINDVDEIFGVANYSKYYSTMDVLLQKKVISSPTGLVVNRPSSINPLKVGKYKNSKKFSSTPPTTITPNTLTTNPNKLLTILTNDVVMILHDLFLNERGLKLRDCLSHGEYDYNTLPIQVDNNLLFTWYIILTKLNGWFESASIQESREIQNRFSFQSQFHPLSLFLQHHQQIQKCYKETNEYFSTYSYTEEIYDDYRDYQHATHVTKSIETMMNKMKKQYKNCLRIPIFGNSQLLTTLKYYEFILNEIEKTLLFIRSTHKSFTESLQSGTIKRRQKDALYKLLECWKEIHYVINHLLMVIQLVQFEGNEEIELKISKKVLECCTKLNRLLEKYCFKDYGEVVDQLIKDIEKILQ
ncbi:DUF4209 domain-containing protein [Entamoeba marina]